MSLAGTARRSPGRWQGGSARRDSPPFSATSDEPPSPFVPLPPATRLGPPRASIDPDPSKSWVRRAWPVLRSHRGTFFLALVASFVGLAVQVQIPALLGYGIGHAIVGVRKAGHSGLVRGSLVDVALLIALLAVVREIVNYFSRRFLLQTAYSIEFDLRHHMYEHFMSLSLPFYDRVQSGQLISRANSDIRAVQLYLVMAPAILVQCAVVVLAFGEMLAIDVPLALVTMATMPLTFVCGVFMRKRIFPVSWLIQSRLAEVATIVEENASGVRVVKSFAAEQQELTTLAKAAERVRWGYENDADVRGAWAPVMENLPRLGLAFILLYGGYEAVHNHVLIGTIVAFNAYMLMFQPPFRQLGMVIMMGQRASASAGRIYEVLDTKPEIVDKPGALELVECRGELCFDDVTFAYTGADGRPGPEVLSHLELRVEPGETVAIVGRTGTGKTTIARLANRSYDVTGGAVRLDGHDVRDLTLSSVRGNVGVVPDEPFLFSTTIRENIAYGRPQASEEEVVAAAKAAGADGFVRRLAEGYDTVVGERGYTLSGGQRQRIAIARALLSNPPVLVLDDATSAIDVQTEQQIHAALRSLLERRTVVLIAHRLSTISLADRVVLVDDGRVVASGTHAELLAGEPRYQAVIVQLEELERAVAAASPDRGERAGGAASPDRGERAGWAASPDREPATGEPAAGGR
ncbi:MAG TPA: ABC transporter ATP-binding protein [Acidimicrobiales bacterium]|nr:ABC transporter ATP-binding protein [Acidimicrobiales bacterium]